MHFAKVTIFRKEICKGFRTQVWFVQKRFSVLNEDKDTFSLFVCCCLFYEEGEEKGNVFKTWSSRLGGNLQRSGDWVLLGRELILNSDSPFCPKHVLHSYTSQHTFKDNFSSWYCLVSFSWLHQWICLHLSKSPAQVAQLAKTLLICSQFCSVDFFQQND